MTLSVPSVFASEPAVPFEMWQYQGRTYEVPVAWDENARRVLVTKYLRRAGVPSNTVPHPEYAATSPRALCPRVAAAHAATGGERSAKQVFDRLAGCWAWWGWRLGYFDADEALTFRDEVWQMLAAQVAAPNSPQWFNTGLNWAYGITGPDSGQWACDLAENEGTGRAEACESVSPVHRAYTRPAPSACFIIGVEDSLLGPGGIMEGVTREATVFKFGGGAGGNFSRLRGKGEPLAGGGVSSGLMSFLDVNDSGAGAIKSGGVTRRAAKMVILDADHPDIVPFVRWKPEEEYRVACTLAGDKLIRTWLAEDRDGDWDTVALIPDGLKRRAAYGAEHAVKPTWPEEPYTAHFDGPTSAYARAGGQNSNNSVRVTNEFMGMVHANGSWTLKYRTGGPGKAMPAADLWREIVNAAWTSGDPGLQFHTTINEWHTCPSDGPIRASNPCSEYLWLDDTACNLASLRLTAFAVHGPADPDGTRAVVGFDAERFRAAVRVWTTVLDITVSMAAYPYREVAERSMQYRTLGLGYCDLGAYLMRSGIGYDSDQGRAVAAAITALMHAEATAQSARLAAVLGEFPRFEDNRDDCLRVVGNHHAWARYVSNPEREPEFDGLSIAPPPLGARVKDTGLTAALADATAQAMSLAVRNGLRNAQLTLLAPTGTIGITLGCDTTGVEPDFSLVKWKSLVGGGMMKIVNRSLPAGLKALGCGPEERERVIAHVFGTRRVPAGASLLLGQWATVAFHADSLEADVTARLAAGSTLERAVWESAIRPWWRAEYGPDATEGTRPLATLLVRGGLRPEAAAAAVAAWEREACGAETVEGSGLPANWADVFTCANRCGSGTASLSAAAHIRMMAAVQPGLSGAISKTVNLPEDASAKDVADALDLAWRSATKAVAVYIDGQKLSQPLTSGGGAADTTGVLTVPERNGAGGIRLAPDPSGPESYLPEPQDADPVADMELMLQTEGGVIQAAAVLDADDAGPFEGDGVQWWENADAGEPDGDPARPPADSPLGRGEREKLPDLRYGYTQKMRLGGHTFYLRTGEYPDGRIGEIFLDTGMEGAAFRALGNALAVAVSLGLQHGVPLDEYVTAFVNQRFEPAGVLQGHARLKMASSFLDAVFRDLAINYLGQNELAQVQVPDARPVSVHVPAAYRHPFRGEGRAAPVAASGPLPVPPPDPTPRPAARPSGRVCPSCREFALQKTGTCETCQSCGFNSGCG